MMVLNSDSIHFPALLLQLLLMGSVVGMCLPFGVVGGRGKKLKSTGLENYAILAINLSVKPFKKIRWRIVLARILSIGKDDIISSIFCLMFFE